MEYKLIKSKRKTVELTIDDELCPVIKAPLNMPQRDIDAFFEKHRRWVQKHTEAKRIRMEKTRFLRRRSLPQSKTPCRISPHARNISRRLWS